MPPKSAKNGKPTAAEALAAPAPLTLPVEHVELVAAPRAPVPQFRIDGNPMLEAAMALAKRPADPLAALTKFSLRLRLTDKTPSFEAFYELAREGDGWLRAQAEALDPRALDLVWVTDVVMRGEPVATDPQPLRLAQLPDVPGDQGGSPLLLSAEAAAVRLGAWLDARVVPAKSLRLTSGSVSVRTDYEQNNISQSRCERAAGVWKDFLDRVGRWPVTLYTSTPDYCRATAKAFDPFGAGEARLLPKTPAELEASEAEFRREELLRVLAQTQTAAGGYRFGTDPTR